MTEEYKTEPIVEFWIPGIPMPKPRPQVTRIGGFSKVYTPDNKKQQHRAWREAVVLAARAVWLPQEIDEAIKLTLRLYMPRPKVMLAKRFPDGPILHTKRGDLDNYEKAIEDPLSSQKDRRGLWVDDGLICWHDTMKFYAGREQETGALVVVSRVEKEGKA